MANPQPENGHIDIANEVAERFAKVNLSPYEWRILWVLLRKTWGWHKKKDIISITQFQRFTGIDRRNVVRTLKGLIKKGIVSKDNSNPVTYGFVKNYENWRVGAKKTLGAVETIGVGAGETTHLLSVETTKVGAVETPTKEKKEKKEKTGENIINNKIKLKSIAKDNPITKFRLLGYKAINSTPIEVKFNLEKNKFKPKHIKEALEAYSKLCLD